MVIIAGQSDDGGRLRLPVGDAVAAVCCCHSSRRLTFKCQVFQREGSPQRGTMYADQVGCHSDSDPPLIIDPCSPKSPPMRLLGRTPRGGLADATAQAEDIKSCRHMGSVVYCARLR